MIHLMRGTPYVFQGEELGMTNAHFTSIDQYKDVESRNYYRILMEERGKSKEETLKILQERSRDNGRTPMQWTGEENAGFTADAVTPWIEVPDYKKEANAKDEMGDPESIRAYYKKLIGLRKEYPIIADGTIAFFDDDNDSVMAYERREGEQSLLVLSNMTADPIRAAVPDGKAFAAGKTLIDSYGEGQTAAVHEDSTITLRPYEAVAVLL